MTTDKAPQGCWVVLDEKGWPTYCAGWPEACHEHINDAILDLPEAAKWRVVQMEPVAAKPPGPVEIDKDDMAAWAKVDAYLDRRVYESGEISWDFTSVQYVDDKLQINGIVGVEVPVEAYRG